MSAYTAPEVAEKLGITLDTFYRTRRWRHEHDGLPLPVSGRGKLRFEASGFDAWYLRHHPLAPTRPANDAAPPIVPANVRAVNAFVAAHYGRKAPAASSEEP
jgi:hypothetical protein